MMTPETDEAIKNGLAWLAGPRMPTARSAAARIAATSP